MKKNIVTILIILAVFFNNHRLFAEQLISLFLKPYPVVSEKNASEKLAPKLDRLGKLATNRSKAILPASVSGIFATYGGFLTVSDLNGEIAFPRKHNKPIMYLVVTEQLTPIIMSGNTIHHWELQEENSAHMYRLEQRWDPQVQVWYWEVSQEPLPENLIVPLESIAIFADPKFIYVPLGITVAKETPHLLLPDVYIKNGLNLTLNALYVLNLSHYFGGILPLYKKQPRSYSRHLTY